MFDFGVKRITRHLRAYVRGPTAAGIPAYSTGRTPGAFGRTTTSGPGPPKLEPHGEPQRNTRSRRDHRRRPVGTTVPGTTVPAAPRVARGVAGGASRRAPLPCDRCGAGALGAGASGRLRRGR